MERKTMTTELQKVQINHRKTTSSQCTLLCEVSVNSTVRDKFLNHLEGLRAVGNISLKMTSSTNEGLWNLNFGSCLYKNDKHIP